MTENQPITKKKRSKLPKDITLGGDQNGTSLNGYITVAYADLVALLGKPNSEGDRYKTDANWDLTVRGKAMSIYNYKDGKNYLGFRGLKTKDITDWHIGGAGDLDKEIEYLSSLLPNCSYRTTF
jgi:hypothetical protein